ncbi:hypothetical protein PVAP13_4KG043066 [Panicum virgatum]|uniref:TTF-type domain-containing protein n=1 Tax=Panicum virgatum TaxID=38727 RepID=A0A8T0TNQ5_PANVG|nr:hypothetical protein PVAP13_4KG043066 [Panicum virgatum]
MERYFQKRNRSLDDDAADTSISRPPLRLKQSHVAATIVPHTTQREIDLDELPYDPADRKRISKYTRNPKKQDEIRRTYLTRGPYRPPPNFYYPYRDIGSDRRRFNPEWFKEYGGWLEYSDKVHKAFCLCYYLFKDCNEGQAGNDAFAIKGWNSWNKKCRLDTHVGKGNVNSFHNVVVKRCDALMNQDQSIQVALDRQTDFTKNQNRIRLNTSIDSVRYLLRQGLAFRGHDESKESKNKGNFRELNEVVRNSIRNAPENCQWICGDIQKEITSYFAKITLKSIIEEIGGDVFSLLIDEASDVSDKEQMTVVLRYLSKRGFIIERLVGVVHVKETSAICLKESLQKLFTDIGLSIQQVRGQCYDGASNMRGEFNGLKSKILQENRSAYYVHCFAHQLQLAIVAVAKKNEDISDFFYMISVLFNVVGGSCKRKDMIKEKHRDDIRKAIGNQTLQRAGDTRWGSHYRTLSSIVKLFPAIVSVLKYVQKEGKNDKKSQARGSANTLSQSLQKKDQDILNAISCNGWNSLLEKVYLFCDEHHIQRENMHEEYVNRHAPRRKTNKTNLQHYKIEVLNSVIDWQLQEFDDRFNEVNSALLRHMAAFNPKDSFAAFNKESLVKLVEFYPDDFDSDKLDDLGHELVTYIDNMRADQRFDSLDGIADLAKLMVETNKHITFPLVFHLLKLVLILPVATASVERRFSAMNIVKKKLRNKMGDQFMSDCLICYVEKDLFSAITNDEVVGLFKKMKFREGKL